MLGKFGPFRNDLKEETKIQLATLEQLNNSEKEKINKSKQKFDDMSQKMLGNSKNSGRTDEVDLTERFSEQMAQLCMNSSYSDVAFIVQGERLPGHRVILAARSEFFRAMLYGGMSEAKQSEITLDVPIEAFKALLKYIYSGHLPLSQISEDHILDILGLANQYGFTDLESAISDYLHEYLNLGNVCVILDAAHMYSMDTLSKVCLMFMDRHATELLTHESFKSLSKESLVLVLSRDTFFADEQEIFLGVLKWCMHNPNVDGNSVLSLVRLPLITLEALLSIVRPSGLISSDKLLDAIAEQASAVCLPYRAALWPEENVATERYSARTIQGDCRATLLDGDWHSYDLDHGYTRHSINDGNDHSTGGCIIVELGTIHMLNYIKLRLWDLDTRAYSYFIETSTNGTKWERVIDYSNIHCRSWQHLYFEARPVKYIKLVGTHNTLNKVFHVVGLEAMYTATVPRIVGGFVAPTYNVATIEMNALVVDGVSRARNALINGDFVNYDWDSGYTCHQLGSGEIVVRLAQPYYVSTMRLLLWDCDDRTYCFYIETSVDEKNWEMVVDKRHEHARSWQNFSFAPRPVIYIRIVGTANTANEIFHCVHLECPSQDPSFLRIEKEKARKVTQQSLSSNNDESAGAVAVPVDPAGASVQDGAQIVNAIFDLM